MFLKLLLLFILIPWIELIVLLKISQAIGFLSTIALILLTGMAGAALARWQGLVTVLRIREALAAGKMPAREIMDGALILAAGLLLITPGFLTDVAGFFLLIPAGRSILRSLLLNYLQHNFQISQDSQFTPPPQNSSEPVIDIKVDSWREDEQE